MSPTTSQSDFELSNSGRIRRPREGVRLDFSESFEIDGSLKHSCRVDCLDKILVLTQFIDNLLRLLFKEISCASAYRLVTVEVRTAPRAVHKPWWWIGSSFFRMRFRGRLLYMYYNHSPVYILLGLDEHRVVFRSAPRPPPPPIPSRCGLLLLKYPQLF